MNDEPVSRSITICGQTLDVDPRTGRTLVNCAKPYSKSSWNEIARPHVVEVVHVDGSKTLATIAGATYAELRDADFVCSAVAGGKIKRRITNEEWHACVMSYAARYPDKVMRQDGYKFKPNSSTRVIVAALIPPPTPAQVRLK